MNPKHQRAGGKKERKKQEGEMRKQTNRDSKTTWGSSDCMLLSAALLPAVHCLETERHFGARIELSGWLAGRVSGRREAMCHSKLMKEILIRHNITSP